MNTLKPALKVLLGIGFTGAGINHFLNTPFYLSMMPPYLPWHLFLVNLSGVFEIVLGIGMLIARVTRWAAWGLIALSIAVFPANIHMAVHSELFPQFSVTALWLRLPLQGVVIAWAYWFTRAPE